MKIDVHIIRGAKLVNIGYIEMEEFNADKCYDICNWRYWAKTKPKNLFANVDTCDKVCFTNPITKRMHLTKSIGWLVGSEEEINEYIQQNANELLWL